MRALSSRCCVASSSSSRRAGRSTPRSRDACTTWHFFYDKLGRDAAAEEFASRAMVMWAEIDGYANGHTYRMFELLARLYARQATDEKLSALINSVIGELERTYPRGYHDASLASLANLLSSNGRVTELHNLGERLRALLD